VPDRELQNVLEGILEGVIVVDRQARVELLNSSASRILETSAEFAGGQSLAELAGPDHDITRLAQRVLETGQPLTSDDVRVERRFSGNAEVDVSVSPLPDSEGGVVLTLRDDTIRNGLRIEETQRARLDSYGHIAAGIAHEVKNPLGGIRGAAELLALRACDEKDRRKADLIVQEVDRITSLVDELMVFARGDRLECKPVNLHRILDGVLDLLALDPLGADAEFERIYDPSIPELYADADRLTQVFLNLGRNALQAMKPGTRSLQITTRMAFEQRLLDASGRAVPTVVVEIRDEGCGIPPEDLERLATPFFTTRAHGTGLGLAVSRHWLSRHGGSLRIESELERGTTVRALLPLTASEPDDDDPGGDAPARGSR